MFNLNHYLSWSLVKHGFEAISLVKKSSLVGGTADTYNYVRQNASNRKRHAFQVEASSIHPLPSHCALNTQTPQVADADVIHQLSPLHAHRPIDLQAGNKAERPRFFRTKPCPAARERRHSKPNTPKPSPSLSTHATLFRSNWSDITIPRTKVCKEKNFIP